MDLHLELSAGEQLVDQIHRQVRTKIRAGTLEPGTRLPSSRQLAERLSVSRATVVEAYARLAAQGFVQSRHGVGMFVADSARPVVGTDAPQPSPVRPRSHWLKASLGVPAPVGSAAVTYNFRCGQPSHDTFPYAHWRALLGDEFRVGSGREIGYTDPAGDARLRSAILRHIAVSRSVHAQESAVIITAGAQQAVDLIARVLLEPGDVVAVEHPGYRPAHAAFRAAGARLVGVAIDDDGLVVDDLPDAARLVYVTPAHQFPMGMPMSAARRSDLLAWAAEHDAVVVEDDYDSEYRYAGRPLTPLYALDREQRVIYVGSFSKTLLPNLRIGFLCAPALVAKAVRRAKFVTDFGTSAYFQAALARFIDDGSLDKYVRRMRRVYERRHYLIEHALQTELADVLALVNSSSGLHIAARLITDRMRDVDIARAVRRFDVHVDVASVWGVDGPGPNALLFGYGAIPTERIADGLARLRTVLD